MLRSLLLLCLCYLISAALCGQADTLHGHTDYEINVFLDTDAKQLRVQQQVFFQNPSADTIWRMPFHIYYNAFKNNRSVFIGGGGGRILGAKSEEQIANCDWGWTQIVAIQDAIGNDLLTDSRFIQPDLPAFTDDHTVWEVRLAEPVLPYGNTKLQLEWVADIPPLMIRTGYNRDYFFMAQWYPKLGVYEPAGMRFATQGQWNCHQYHANTEYYGEFGTYDLWLDVPADFVVGSSGTLQDSTQSAPNRQRYHYQAKDVIDVTWTAYPRFEEVWRKWEPNVALQAEGFQAVDLRLLITPEHLCNKERFFIAAAAALDFFADYLGPYPYPQLTIVSPPYHGLKSGAMEYPTLFTAPTLCALPKGILTTETLTIHELAHQYFMQMLATNEQEEPWMDEGFTSFVESKIMDQTFPGGVVHLPWWGIKIGSSELRRGRFLAADNIKVNPLSDFGWYFEHGSYSPLVYGKSAVWLQTLEGLVGEKVMQEIMRTYYQRWRFRHPGREDFRAIVNEIVPQYYADRLGPDMNWFFDQGILGTDFCDYAVHSITNVHESKPVGYFGNPGDCQTGEAADMNNYVASTILFRHGNFIIPQEVSIQFDDGSEVLEYWDGKSRSKAFSYTGSRMITTVIIDPADRIALDVNKVNNSRRSQVRREGANAYSARLLSWLAQLFISLTFLV